jgi:hypothetical protein
MNALTGYKQVEGKILANEYGREASVIIPIGDYKVMILTDDSCGAGKGKVVRSEIHVYYGLGRITDEVFGCEGQPVIADAKSIKYAMDYCFDDAYRR